jgi:O-antigen/teichoic acid export membrane protein
MLVLVRLLPPEAYGQFSLVTSIIAFLAIFSFNNFVAHTLQVRNDENAHFQDHFTAGAMLQIGIFVLTNLIAVALRSFPKYAPVAPLVHVMSLTFLLEWPCELRRKMLEREFDWRKLRILHGVGLLLNAALAVAMALLGAGTYALLLPGLMVTLPFTYDLFVRQKWRPAWSWSWKNYKPAWHFGITRAGSGLTLNGRQLLESAVLSAVLGFAALGVLNRSIGLAQIFCYKIATQLIYAIYPVLTRAQTGEANAQRVGGLVLRTVAWTVVPTAVCLGVLAWPVVQTVYGAKWMGVVPLLPWAMAWGASAALMYASYMLLLSRQHERRCLVADLLNLTGTGLSLWLALPRGTVTYLTALVCVQAGILTLLLFWLRGMQAVAWRGVAEALFPTFICAGAGALGTTLLFKFLLGIAPDNFIRAFAWGSVFILLYTGTLRLIFAQQLSTLINYIPGRGPISRVLGIRLSP